MTDCKASLISILPACPPTNPPLRLTVLNKAGNLGHLDFAEVFARFELRPVRILNFEQFAGNCTTWGDRAHLHTSAIL